jgi:beta-xylosidase
VKPGQWLRRAGKRRSRVRVAGLAAVAALLTACLTGCETSKAPAYGGDFPDPSVVVAGGVYWAFGTEALGGSPHIQRIYSTDMRAWRVPAQPEALFALPKWADGFGTWAPTVQQIGNRWVMYYSAHQTGGHECLSVASAASPADQFVDSSTKPFLCLPNGETIDPSTFLSPDGRRWLVWKGPLGSKGVATIFTQRLTPDGLTLVKNTRGSLMQAQPKGWTKYNVEAPSVLYWQGKYLLFYTGGNYWTSGYAMGYAVCRTPVGPCTDMSAKKPWVATHNGAYGPGGGSFFIDLNGHIQMAYHAWGKVQGYDKGGKRTMWIDQLAIINGVPMLI